MAVGGHQDDKAGTPNKALLAAYRQVLLCVFMATVFLSLTIGLALTIFRNDPKVLIFVTLAGALGAFFSALMRLYNFKDLPRALTDGGLGLTNAYLVIYSLVPPMVGAIGATALYLAFISGLIEGALFPSFKCYATGGVCDGFDGLISSYGPENPEDYAKALIWGFLAGFSERLVPDLLQEAVSRKQQAGGTGNTS